MLIEDVGLAEKRNTAYEKLSGGQKQRLSIAAALIGNPDIAILDELTTGLDPQARREIWVMIEQIRTRGVTILLVSHFMEEVERLCDRVAVTTNGRIAAIDTPGGLVIRTHGEQRQIEASEFRTEQATLDDAFFMLTNCTSDNACVE